jgi:cytochrome c553
MKRSRTVTTIALAAGLACGLGVTPAMADPGRNLAAACANCHGTDGRSLGGVPSLAGQSKAVMLQSLREFRDGKRPATIMHQLAKGYTDAQFELLADYFSRQPTSR